MYRARPRLALFTLLIVFAVAPRADGACNATCKRDMERCKATQCEGVAPSVCRRRCKPAAIRTLAYVVSECREDAAGAVGHQELRIRRGDGEPIPVVAFDVSEQNLEPLRGVFPVLRPPCATWGFSRWGGFSVVSFPLQRLGVSPDGSGLVFEVNDEFSKSPSLSPEQTGMFYVRSDGRGLRRLGPPSHEQSHRQTEVSAGFAFSPPMFFSPNGHRIAFTDIGPGPSGPTAQIFVLDLATGRRMQVTQLPAPSTPPRNVFGEFLGTCCPTFVDDDTVAFQTFVDPDGSNPDHRLAAFLVRIDGSGLKVVRPPIAVAGSEIVPTFGVFGGRTNLLRLPVPGTPVSPPTTPRSDFPIAEIFLREGKRLLQLTNLRRVDTFPAFVNAARTRAFFLASADPFKMNPSRSCQLFSVDTFGGGLRQVTQFTRHPDRVFGFPGCFAPGAARAAGCAIGYGYYRVLFQDPMTKAVVFDSNCDPVGANPTGDQVFAMRPDGFGLRQLTEASGVTENPDGSIRVEFAGPFAYSARPD